MMHQAMKSWMQNFIDVFTFSAPKVGGIDFTMDFQCQEKGMRMPLFCFNHKQDVVPQLPPKDVYRHDGLSVELIDMFD